MTVPISNPESTLEDLENDIAALEALFGLAHLGAMVMRGEMDGTIEEYETLKRWIAPRYSNGAGAFEPDAVLAWVRGKVQETENTIDALTGAGPPLTAEEEEAARSTPL